MMDILQVGFTHASVSWWYALIPESISYLHRLVSNIQSYISVFVYKNESESNKFVKTAYVLFLSTDIYIYI